jgi:RNA polymerase sigma factor (sigma-70 family)
LAVEDADTRIGREEDTAIVYERRRRQREVRAAFEEASHQVSASSYRIIVLHLLEGCEYDEIAESLGMPVVRVRDQHRRAYRVLRDLLIGRFGSDPSGPLILQRKKSLASTRSIVIVEVRS